MLRFITVLASLVYAGVALAGTTAYESKVVVRSSASDPTCATSSGDGYVCAENGVESEGVLNVAGASTLTGAVTASSTLDVTGIATFSSGVELSVPVGALEVIRFCGNGHSGATPTYMGPVLLDDTEADLAFGGAGCDGLDNTTVATADAPWHSSFAYKPVAMVCVGRCTGATAANDAVTYALVDDTALVSGMACTAAAWSGDDSPAQCSVRDTTPATVAANSAVAIKISGTDDACTDAGDDFECLLYVTF